MRCATLLRVLWAVMRPDVDIRAWLPGDGWDVEGRAYTSPAPTHSVTGAFAMPKDLARGRYILALAILDPAAGPFRYRHFTQVGDPIGIGARVDEAELPAGQLRTPYTDGTLHHIY